MVIGNIGLILGFGFLLLSNTDDNQLHLYPAHCNTKKLYWSKFLFARTLSNDIQAHYVEIVSYFWAHYAHFLEDM